MPVGLPREAADLELVLSEARVLFRLKWKTVGEEGKTGKWAG